MKQLLICFLFFLGGLFESTIIPLPLLFIFLLILTVWKRDISMFFIASGAGLLLDLFMVRSVGSSSLFFVCSVFLFLSYQRKYEIRSYQFVIFASFFGSLIYLILFSPNGIVMYTIFSCILAVIFYKLVKLLLPRQI